MPWLEYMLSIDWTGFGKTALSALVGAGVGSAGVTVIATALRERRQRKARAAYMTMRLAVILEAYTLACQEYLFENDAMETPPNDEYPYWELTLPEVAAYPDDVDGWTAIDRTLAGSCLSLRNKREACQRLIYWTREYTEDELEAAWRSEAARLGMEAWRIAKELRRIHRVEGDNTAQSAGDYLQEQFDRVMEHRRLKEERARERAREREARRREVEALDIQDG
ncbi:MAG: hypothetical protein AB7F35_27445 [Acetobacteraceae bacterium]